MSDTAVCTFSVLYPMNIKTEAQTINTDCLQKHSLQLPIIKAASHTLVPV